VSHLAILTTALKPSSTPQSHTTMSGIKGYLDRSIGVLRKNTSQSMSLVPL
jgi:hypothetical protein